ncbi:MAG TPA: Npt1/Npt2 family nucleotide transporter [Gemmatimonadaceae bacterium]|nr:Npt1/Npt2 family nucleotide transporter [Gemmatimonadaceae bacterium]
MIESSNPPESSGPFHALLRRAVDVRADEVRAMMTSFCFFFFLLSSYFVLRPIRDAVAAASGVNKLPWLFMGTLAGTLICNPLFSGLVVRLPVRRVIPISYHFFTTSFLAFYAVLRFVSSGEGSTVDIWMGRIFFVWITVFALFNTSIFWTLMADVWRSEQAKRLFGFIGVGGTAGSIIGSAATAALAPQIGAVNMLLVSAALIELAVVTITLFPMHSSRASVGGDQAARPAQADREVIGGSVWAGFTHVVKSPYLFVICIFQILYVFGSTVLYFAQSDIVGHRYPNMTARTAVLADLELAAQVLTVTTQLFLTGRILRWFGLAVGLAVLPVVSMIGFGILGLLPVFGTMAAFTVLRRGMNFAVTNPAVEVLFTVVKREDKYKAKNVIETFVYRGGDQVAAWVYAGLAAVGLGLAGISFVAVPVSAVWLALAVWLGRRQAQLAAGDVVRHYSPSGPTTGPALVEPSRQPT